MILTIHLADGPELKSLLSTEKYSGWNVSDAFKAGML